MTIKAKIEIEGMHCASCASNIERSLKKIHGVKTANVNLVAKKGFVELEHDVSEEELRKAVSRVGGYKAGKVEFEGEMSPEMPSMTMAEHEAMKHKEQTPEGHQEHTEHYLTEEDEHHHEKPVEESEIKTWRRRMLFSWLIAIPIIFLTISERIFGLKLFEDNVIAIISLVFGFPIIFIFGWSTLKGGFKGFLNFYFNMDSLITLGTVIAYFTGILSLVGITLDYSGVSAMIMAFFLTGKYVEMKARGQASQEIRKLLELGAKNARILKSKEEEIEIPISEIKIGDIMIIKPGEKVPTDGIVIRGESAVDESMISGESMPVEKKKGSNVIGATINQDGILYVKATKIGRDTFLAHIIKLVEEAQGTKIPIQVVADKITSLFVPVVLVISILTFGGWWYFTTDLSRAISVAISVLVIACPCALGLATPTALMVGTGMGAKRGILIRKGEAIQTMKNVKTIIFDKTGTITKGSPEVVEIYTKIKENYLLDTAASLEKLSEHPIAKAIVKKANLKSYRKVSSFKVLRGRGIEGKIEAKNIVIGNMTLIKEREISVKGFEDKIEAFEQNGWTTMIVSENEKALGVIAVADAVKEDSLDSITQLNQSGYKTVMITGDNERTARAIADKVGIKEIIANVLPEEKVKITREMKKYGMVAFVGDGINDAPALKESNVGIAMGTGTDIAIEAGDIVLATGSLRGVVQAINLSKATFRKIKQNLFWAFFYNIVAIPVAIAGLLHPVIAEIAMATSSVSVVGNANLLRRKRI